MPINFKTLATGGINFKRVGSGTVNFKVSAAVLNYNAGLYKTTYAGYHSENPVFFATATPATYGANPATSIQTTIIQEPSSDDGSNFSVQWLGYFKPITTETYTLFILSDDGSYLWIGANALSGFTTANANLNNEIGRASCRERV
jgi:hypothetical protein